MTDDLRRSFQPDPRAAQMIDEASIPVLTEKLILPAVDLDVSLPPTAPPSPPEAAVDSTPAALERPAPAIEASATPADALPTAAPEVTTETEAEPTTDAIVAAAREQAIAQLQAELGPALEAAVRTRVAAAVDDALLDMLALLQISLESQIRSAVKDALDEQLAAARERTSP